MNLDSSIVITPQATVVPFWFQEASEAEYEKRYERIAKPAHLLRRDAALATLPDGPVTAYRNRDEDTVNVVLCDAIHCGYEVRLVSRCKLEIGCTRQQLRGMLHDRKHRNRLWRVWTGSCFANGDGTFSQCALPRLVSWTSQFREYIRRLWYDSGCPCAVFIKTLRGPNAGNPVLVPLIMTAEAGGVFELDDPVTLSFWLDYLNEYPERKRAWKTFERKHGTQPALYWENEIGQQWKDSRGIQ